MPGLAWERVKRSVHVNSSQTRCLRRDVEGQAPPGKPRHTATPDLLGIDFTATAPNTSRFADLTRIPDQPRGYLSLASVQESNFSPERRSFGSDHGPRGTAGLIV